MNKLFQFDLNEIEPYTYLCNYYTTKAEKKIERAQKKHNKNIIKVAALKELLSLSKWLDNPEGPLHQINVKYFTQKEIEALREQLQSKNYSIKIEGRNHQIMEVAQII